jgi:hypothetical protein
VLKTEMALRYYHNPPYGKLINRAFLMKNNIKFEEVIAANDVMFSAKVGSSMKRYAIDRNVIYCITRGSGSLTMNIDEHIFDIRLNVFINYYKYLYDSLTNEQFKALNLLGWGKVVDVFKYRLGLKKVFRVIYRLMLSGVKIVSIGMFNPFTSGRKILRYIKRYNSEKKYMGKS